LKQSGKILPFGYISLILKTVPQTNPQKDRPFAQNNSNFILIGEDDLDDEEFLKEIFSTVDNSFSLEFMNNGKKLVSRLGEMPDNHLPCLILLDYNMPEMNGAEILKELKTTNRYHSIPKMIWSTSKSNLYRDICLGLGATDYVVKPSNVNELIEVVRQMLSYCKT
jgi:CheY-like chemotaxis protein